VRDRKSLAGRPDVKRSTHSPGVPGCLGLLLRRSLIRAAFSPESHRRGCDGWVRVVHEGMSSEAKMEEIPKVVNQETVLKIKDKKNRSQSSG